MRSQRTTIKPAALFRRLTQAGGWPNSSHSGYHTARCLGLVQHPVLAQQQQQRRSASSVASLAPGTDVETSGIKPSSASLCGTVEETLSRERNMSDTRPRRRSRRKAGRQARGGNGAIETQDAPPSSQATLPHDAPQPAAVSGNPEGATHHAQAPASSDLLSRLVQMIHANGVGNGGAPTTPWAASGQPPQTFQQAALPAYHGAAGWTSINQPAPFAAPTPPPHGGSLPLEDYIRQSLRSNPASPLNQQPAQRYSTQTSAGDPLSRRLDEPAQPDDPALDAPAEKSKSAKSLRKAANRAAQKEARRLKEAGHSDPIVKPSAASGGIPEPSPGYLLRASFTTNRLISPRPLLVVLDLNGTLLFRPYRKQPRHFVARPHAHTFLDYITTRFWVVVWSSARPQNVGSMIDSLLPRGASRDRLVAVWSRDDLGLSRDDYNRRVQVYKRLSRLWADNRVARSHPDFAAAGTRWGQGDTVLVDDSVEKARSEPHNLICVPEWVGDMKEEPQVLPRVHDYINELCYQSDVSTYIRANPFRVE